MSRRSFLRAGLLAATVAATVDVEQLLWTPGEKTILLPELAPYSLDEIDWFTRNALDVLKRNLTITKLFNREYDEKFRVGDTVSIRLPQRFEPYDHSGLVVARTVPVTLTHMQTRRRA